MKMSKETEAMSLTDMVTYIKTNQAGIDKDVDNRIMEILFKIGYIIGKKNGKFRGFKNVYGPDHEENTLNDFCVYLMMKLYSFLCKNGPSSITNIYYYINGYFEIYANNFLGGFFLF